MLNSSALQQLTQLKQEIRSNKDMAEGVVRGSKGRYGFVRLDDDREAFLNPEEMQRVFPGDRVEVSLSKNEKDQYEAKLEKLISTELNEFVGQYLDRGNAHFAVPDVYGLSRWIFLPPKQRAKGKAGDFIRCKISRHPFQDGKCQAKVTEIIGKPEDEFIERKYTVSKHQLPDHWTEQQLQLAQELENKTADNNAREDLTHLPFVTIDSPSTQDMDDAIYAEQAEDGWRLFVAIADPSDGITLDSILGQEALKRGQTVYLPGQYAPMIPSQLANGSYSLIEGQKRLALVAKVSIHNDGSVREFSISLATIVSAAKLSYDQVSQFIDTGEEQAPLSNEIKESLTLLNQVAQARFQQRSSSALVMEDRPDYDYRVDEHGKIIDIVKTDRNSAQRIVEEAMLVTNQSAGEFFTKNNIPALYSTHLGFKPDRLAQVTKLLKEDLADSPENITELPGYVALIQQLQSNPENSGLFSVLKRQLRPSELSLEPAPHMGLGFNSYATITSPIRRFNDLYNHLALKHFLNNSKVEPLSSEMVSKLKDRLSAGRMACRELERWLISQYMQQHIDKSYNGIVAMINSQGIGVRLEENGVDAFIQLRDRKNKNQKIEFNPDRLTLTVDDVKYQFNDSVSVVITQIDQDRRQVLGKLG